MSKKKPFVYEFNETKDALLRYYATYRASAGVHLIGFTAGLFTLIQIVQFSRQEPLSGIFSNVNTVLLRAREHVVFEVLSGFVMILKFPLFFVGVSILLFFIIRTIFRFALFAYLSDYLIRLKPCEVFNRPEPIHDAIHNTVVDNIEEAKQKVYGVFHLIWFISRGKEKRRQYWTGLLVCSVLAVISAAILMLFLW